LTTFVEFVYLFNLFNILGSAQVKDNGNGDTEQHRIRVLNKTIDKVFKSMHELVDLGYADGFVCGIIPKNGKLLSLQLKIFGIGRRKMRGLIEMVLLQY